MGEEIIKREGGAGVGEWEKDTWTDDGLGRCGASHETGCDRSSR